MAKRFTDLEKALRLRGLATRLETACDDAPDPAAAAAHAPDILRPAAGRSLGRVWKRSPEVLCRIAALLGGGAPFFASIFANHPDWLIRLAEDDLESERQPEEFLARLTEALGDTADRADTARVLREFKYYELARITVRDLGLDLVPLERTAEILAELSHLADALLDRALDRCREWVDAKLDGDPPEVRFAVIGMGKLGSEELNYSSDVDLIYVCEDRESGGALDGTQYTTRIAEEFGKLVRGKTGDGFLYRVDLDLRPEGASGPLVVSAASFAEYYECWAETWEKAAVMKARPVAGDAAFGWRVIRSLDPMVFRSSMDLGAIEAIRAMKDKIEQAKGRDASAFNVKLGKGGIRDIEFVAQALQLMHGGRRPQVRQRSTQASLEALSAAGVLDTDARDDLLAAYRFLRRIENRIQMEDERQLYKLPTDADGLTRIARSLGYLETDGAEHFSAALQHHRERVQAIFGQLFDRAGGGEVLDLFQRNAPALVANPTARSLIESLARQFSERVDHSANPERAMNNLAEFIRGVGQRRFFYELLLDRPELVPRLIGLFAASEYLSTYVATHPRLIEPLFDDPNVLLHSRAELDRIYEKIRKTLDAEGLRVEPELSLDALRLFHNRELVNVGLLDMDDRIERVEAERSLTEIGEVCIERGLDLAEQEVRRRGKKRPPWLRNGEFLVVAMGKLASREITYGSDLDVIFLYDLPGGDEEAQLSAQSGFVGLAQKLIWTLQTRTNEGVCYEIDARLRPSGNQGLLVSHIETFADYHSTSAAPWERQALLRSRPVAGSKRLAATFEELRREILLRDNPSDLRQEVHRIRIRMETELARESTARRDFKTGRGGLLDIETAVQYLQLAHARAHPALIDVSTVAEKIVQLAELQILDPHQARTFADGWEFLQRLSSRLRILENRSISDLDAERGDLDDVARRLGYESPGRSSGGRRSLLDEYQRRTAEIRAVYEQVLGITGAETPAAKDEEPAVKTTGRSRRKIRTRTAAGHRKRR